ncbi:MAG: POTRA domain-containing protein [Flavobacteriales bacterium]
MSASSCTIFNRIDEGEVYFKKHRIKVHDAPEDYKVESSNLISLTKFKPNRRILVARFNLGIYTLVPPKALERSKERVALKCEKKNARRAKKGKKPKTCSNLWMWMAYTVGEPPAQLDSSKMEVGAEQMSTYLSKRGFFNNKVEPEVIYKNKGIVFWRKGEKAKVTYHVYPNTPYHIRNVKYVIDDEIMAKRTDEIKDESMIHPGDLFDVDVLDSERDRIANYFNNRGYYEFTKDYIVYDVDSTVGNLQADVTLKLRRPKSFSQVKRDSLVYVPHKKYFIGNIYVFTDSDPLKTDEEFSDTIHYEGLTIISNGEPDIKESLIEYTTIFKTSEMYQKDRVELTYRRYTQLGTNKAVNIQLIPRPTVDSSGVNILDAYIRLTPAKKQIISFDPRLTNRSGNTGLYGNVVYKHKNVFRGAESLEFKIVTGFEATRAITEATTNSDGTEDVRRSFQLNTFEFGPELSLRVPRIVGAPFVKMKKNSEPFTNFSLAVNYQRRPDYERTLTQLRTQWGFTENKDKGTKFFPHWDLSIIDIKKSDAFEAFLIRLNDSFLANSYQNHLVHSAGVDFVQNTQKPKFQRHYLFHKYGIEFAGKIFPPLIAKSLGVHQDEAGSYYFGGIRYADYVKVDGDSRYYFNLNERNAFVFRASGGLGVAGKNLPVLPFEESFFCRRCQWYSRLAGKNSGPGSYRDTSDIKTFNNIGDVKLEFNVEYRFKLTQMFQAAFL